MAEMGAQFIVELWPPRFGNGADKWDAMDASLKAAYTMGWRHLAFCASVTVLDGRVSAIEYGLEPDVFMGWPIGYLVTSHSAHGFWMARHFPLPISSPDDESYQLGFIASEFSWFRGNDIIGVAYTPDAPPDKIAHVYHVDLSRFWNLLGCNSVRQVVPLLWKDREETLAATNARLASNNPCSDSILAGRVRTLPDLNVALLEVVQTKYVEVNTEGDKSSDLVVDYRLKEVLLGYPEEPWTGVHLRRQIGNPALRTFPRAGEQFLYFTGAKFDSCRMVPATLRP